MLPPEKVLFIEILLLIVHFPDIRFSSLIIIATSEFVMEFSIILRSKDSINQGIGSSTAKYFAEKQEMHNNQKYCSTLVIDFSHLWSQWPWLTWRLRAEYKMPVGRRRMSVPLKTGKELKWLVWYISRWVEEFQEF